MLISIIPKTTKIEDIMEYIRRKDYYVFIVNIFIIDGIKPSFSIEYANDMKLINFVDNFRAYCKDSTKNRDDTLFLLAKITREGDANNV